MCRYVLFDFCAFVIIESPRYTHNPGWLCFCTGSYAGTGTADFCSRDNFRTTFRISFIQFDRDWWPWPINYLIRFWSLFVMTVTLNFQGQIWNLLQLSQKWSDCHETKNKHIDWTQGLKCDHHPPVIINDKVLFAFYYLQAWPWPWPSGFLRSNIEFALS